MCDDTIYKGINQVDGFADNIMDGPRRVINIIKTLNNIKGVPF